MVGEGTVTQCLSIHMPWTDASIDSGVGLHQQSYSNVTR